MVEKIKNRLDTILLQRGLCETRQIAQSLILQGKVKVDGKTLYKSGTPVLLDCHIEIEESPFPYVSRGGLKLAHALSIFRIPIDGKIALDVGASTGGFTHCLLMNGASKVYSIDVGRGQLDYRLRKDPRVVCLEKKNARFLSNNEIPEVVDVITVDVSFISLMKILNNLKQFLADSGYFVTLVKPQFEAGPRLVKKGVVKDPLIHSDVIMKILQFAGRCSLSCENITYSPIKGPSGNIEFFILFRHGIAEVTEELKREVLRIVAEAHEKLRQPKY